VFDLIINRSAKRYQRSPQLLRDMANASRNRCRVWSTRSLAELDQVVAEVANLNSEFVAFSGGDGSLMAGLSAFYRLGSPLPAMTALPGGTTGTIARNFGVTGHPLRALKRLLDSPRRRRKQACLLVQGHALPAQLGFIFGTGLVANFFKLYDQHGAAGLPGAASLVAQIFAGSFVGGTLAKQVLEPMACRVWVEGEPLEANAFSLVCCSVLDNLGLGMRLTYRAAEDPQRPHLVVSADPPRQLGPQMPRVLAGRSIVSSNGFDGLTRKFRVDFPATGAYVLDGDLIAARSVEVKAGPELTWIDAVRG
jgi:diacylglycerol kinase (ATP)